MGTAALLGLALPLLMAAPKEMPFQVQILPYTDEQGPRVRVFVGVPHRELQFLKTTEGYVARFRVAVEAFETGSAVAVGEDWEASVRTTSYAATVAPRSWRTTCRTIHLDPGRYRFTIEVKDLSSDRVGQKEQELALAVADRRGLAVQSFLVEKGRGGCKTTKPFWSQHQPETLSVLWHLWAPDVDSAGVRLQILDVERKSVYERELVSPVRGRPQVLDLGGVELPPGTATLRLEASAAERKSTVEKKYHVRPRAVPSGERSLDLMIRQMRAVMEPEDYERISSLPAEEKRAAFEEFWAARDPTPETEQNELQEEFFSRVEAVEEQFSFGETPGWETDRGRIYLVYGRPDERKTYTSGRFEEKLHEVWRYYGLRRRFVFVDELGTGDFVLVSSS
jgi:GWxTD domain-containing protein